jgi:oxygen-independent coproporphyrinogen III oxidase
MAGLYLHIPFCKKACHYCDFHFSTQLDSTGQLREALSKELTLQANYLNDETLETIYFGGGTPSVLSSKELEQIFNSIQKNFAVDADAEITLEANPDDLSPEKIRELRDVGVNRLSIGIQSLDDQVLSFLNRSHNAGQALKCIESARKADFSNINVDLIYAIPERSISLLKKDIDELLNLEPEHISAYSLTIEEKTVFGNWAARGKFKPEEEEENAHQFELVMDMLADAGFEQYEISNYAKPGFQSRHNSSYWKQKMYLGVGPSAHSFNGYQRQVNVPNNQAYIKALSASKIPATLETLSREDQINEYIMTSLRTMWGCNNEYLISNFQYDLLHRQREYLQRAIVNGLIQIDEAILKLTRTGKMHADKIASDLFLVDPS